METSDEVRRLMEAHVLAAHVRKPYDRWTVLAITPDKEAYQ